MLVSVQLPRVGESRGVTTPEELKLTKIDYERNEVGLTVADAPQEFTRESRRDDGARA
jgi:hypothetical protein